MQSLQQVCNGLAHAVGEEDERDKNEAERAASSMR